MVDGLRDAAHPGEDVGVRVGVGHAERRTLDRLAELRRVSERVWGEVDVILTPTAGTHYTIAQMLEDPIKCNSDLGYYTNFMNLLDLAAVAVPSGFQANGLPFGITLTAPAFTDRDLLALAARLHAAAGTGAGVTRMTLTPPPPPQAPAGELSLAVCGAHMSGLPLNHELTARGGRLLSRTTTSADYRLYLLPGGPPQRPGLVRVDGGGAMIEVEVWALPAAQVGSFMAGIPAPLAIGRVQLADGAWTSGFVCEGYALAAAREVTALRGWRAFLNGK